MLGYLRSGSKRTKMIWWVVTIATVFTFIIGFSFFGSMGRDPSWAARQSGAYGEINGRKITREMWQQEFDFARESYRQRYGSDPTDRDLKTVEQQAWHDLVTKELFAQQARRAGLGATDNEVVMGMKTSPPQSLLGSAAFQTDGKFDPQKYSAAIQNPSVDWSPFEEQLRQELPVRKLQEVFMASLKLSESELRQTWLDHYERLTATIVHVPAADSGSSSGSEAELQAAYEKYRTRIAGPARTQLEVLGVPVQFSAEEIRSAMDLAKGYAERARKGEDFAQLAKDNSEGSTAARGGVIPNWINPAQVGPLGQQLAQHKVGDVLDPYREASSVMVFKILDPKSDSTSKQPYPGALKLAQIVVRVRPSSESLRQQYETVTKIAERAKTVGLSRAATEKGLATQKTGFYGANYAQDGSLPQQLYSTPEAADWGLWAKKGEISPVFQSPDFFLVAQVALQHAAGPATREEVQDQLKSIADLEHRVDLTKPRADKIAAALAAGQTLEQASAAAGVAPVHVNMTRLQPDPNVASAPELQGALWAGKPGKVVGPIRTPAGWFFGRLESIVAPPDTLWNERVKGELTNDILSRRQRSFLENYLQQLQAQAHIKDNRSVFGAD